MAVTTSMQAVRVAVDTPKHTALGLPLTYHAPTSIAPGTLVQVPLGRRLVRGIVWPGAPDAVDAARIKPVATVDAVVPPFGAEWCALVEFAATYYQRGIGELALAAVPVELRLASPDQLAARVARLYERLAARTPDAVEGTTLPVLAEEQQAALDRLAALQADASACTVLLHGATGSGKTEVYLRAARRALDAGRQAMLLVPEINLTPQLEAQVAARFPDRLTVSLHSGLTPAQRLQNWLAAHLGLADLVLGTRLAVFASMPRLGLLIVDEEHDPAYKQQEGARYSARDIAVYRGRAANIPVLLGSATPSLESWRRAQQGAYCRVSMPTRIGSGALPQVRLVDMARDAATGRKAPALSPPLREALQSRIDRGEQSILFLNRRGYAPVLHCAECGWKSACPHCSAWRVFHKVDRTLRCHHCGSGERVPMACPECGNPDIQPLGRGTERLEEQLAEVLVGRHGGPLRVARIDADSTRRRGALGRQLGAMHAGEVDVLVGTQMVAKGHDFRRVTLVGAVDPDASLFSNDFRAPERLFALLMQAAGRAGRDAVQAAHSEMWVQTWHPRHPLYAALGRHDYTAFADSQLAEREMAGLPPYAHLALLRAEARTAEAARWFLLQATAAAADLLDGRDGTVLYPPVPTTVARVADTERMQMLIDCPRRAPLQRLLAAWIPRLHAIRSMPDAKANPILRWAIDVDPLAI